MARPNRNRYGAIGMARAEQHTGSYGATHRPDTCLIVNIVLEKYLVPKCRVSYPMIQKALSMLYVLFFHSMIIELNFFAAWRAKKIKLKFLKIETIEGPLGTYLRFFSNFCMSSTVAELKVKSFKKSSVRFPKSFKRRVQSFT